ncbi:hypothetical protein B9Z65_1428 [Elsinoe australis]|uniref:Uncharacterized protein n=1 Tax=Elsinoe australis TaxID=40998 RepID=A0A2P7YFW1_9PEZI|nr:hypothetical protein B9Z65_1428 [Elsinoe australis]
MPRQTDPAAPLAASGIIDFLWHTVDLAFTSIKFYLQPVSFIASSSSVRVSRLSRSSAAVDAAVILVDLEEKGSKRGIAPSHLLVSIYVGSKVASAKGRRDAADKGSM